MTEKILKQKNNTNYTKNIKLLDDNKLKNLNQKTIQVLKQIAKHQTYPKHIAKTLDMHEQKIYYHVKKLEEAGLIKVYKTEKTGGALCKFYKPTSEAYGFTLDNNWTETKIPQAGTSEKIQNFFQEFIEKEKFQGSIVVGSPKEHGPFMTSARDGHYAVQLGLFLGKYTDLENRFVVKLDTEVKAENALDRHLMMVGGPITNIISRDLNDSLDVKFDWEEKTWEIVSDITDDRYSEENIGLIAKIWQNEHARILLSGLDFKGTKTCIIGITQYYDQILENYKQGEEYYKVIKGLDRDGDGKTDDIKILE